MIFDGVNPNEMSAKKAETAAPVTDPRPESAPPSGKPDSANSESSVVNMAEIWDTEVKQQEEIKKVKPEDLQKAVANFSPQLDPELMAQATSGEEGATEAMQKLLSSAMQQAITASAQVSSEVSSSYLGQEREAINSRAAAAQRNDAVFSDIRAQFPSIKESGPVANTINQLTAKYFTANPKADPKQAASDIANHLKQEFNLQQKSTEPEETSNETDWSNF